MNRILFYSIILIGFTSCKPLQKITELKSKNSLSEVVTSKLNSKKSQFYTCENISIRIVGEDEKNFKAKFFISTGKLIFVSINILGFEIGRAQISPDSIKYINRIKREFYFGEISNFYKKTGIDLNYMEIENFLIRGVPLNENDNLKRIVERFYESGSDYIYYVQDDLKRFIKIYVDKNTLKEYRIELTDHQKGIYLIGLLDDYMENPFYPGSFKISFLKDDKKMDLDISVGKIENSNFRNISFKVNNNYNELVF